MECFYWTRENGDKVSILEMNNFHLLASIRKLEKEIKEDSPHKPPKLYFAMVGLAYSRGLGITDKQIRMFISQVVP